MTLCRGTEVPVSKTQIAIDLFQRGDLRGALRLASGFRIGLTREQQATLKRGFECLSNPEFYRQLGKDPQQLIDAATDLFRSHFLR